MEPSVAAPCSLPRRRSHLPSRTYRSLVRICSGFSGDSRVSLATPAVLQELLLRSDGNANNEAAQGSPKETCEPEEICPPRGDTEPENSSMLESRALQNESAAPQCCKDAGLGESTIVSNDTENVSTDKTDTTYQENSLILGNNFDAIDMQDVMDGRSQMIMDELELILNEENDLFPEDCMNLLEILDVSDGNSNMIASLEDNAKEPLDPKQNVVEKPSIADELQVGPKEAEKKISDSVDLPPEKGTVEEVPKSVDCKEGTSSGISMSCHETQCRTMELEKSVSTSHGVTPMIVDEDIEEGEISGDVYIDFDDLPLGDDASVERMDGDQVNKDMTDNGGTNDSNSANREKFSSNPSHAVISPPEIVFEKGQRECRGNFDAEVGNLDGHTAEDEKVESVASGSYETSCKEKLNGGSIEKKRARPEKKSGRKKSKANFRKRRAEERRLLGIKRPKLKPIVARPKPPCQRYLKGRCPEGENCRYSHDVEPLTKSLPCRFLAVQSCMKGDDCPYDHDLSKYPCTNFNTEGFCRRGDSCLFSHKGTPGSALDASKEKSNTSGPSLNNVAAASFSFGVSPQKTNDRTATDMTTKPPTAFPTRLSNPVSFMKPSTQSNLGSSFPKPSVAPKGVSFLSLDKTSSEKSHKAPQHGQASSPSIADLLKLARQKTTAQTTPITVNHNPNETLQRSPLPPAPPKGINFVSFGSDRDKGKAHANAPEEDRARGTVQQTSLQPSTSGHAKATAPIFQTQKTLISALKFAAEFESGKTKKCTSGPAAVNKLDSGNSSDVTVSSRNNTSKILEFLASFSKTGNS